MSDGLFTQAGQSLRFHPTELSENDVSAVQRAIRQRVLRVAERHGYLSAETVAELKHWDHGGGFSVHAGVLIGAEDRAALERLLRYCARPAFASERLEWESEGSDGTHAVHSGEPRVRYMLPKPGRDGQTVLVLTPLEFLDRVAALPMSDTLRRRASALWAWLIARIYDGLPLTCPQCGTEMKLVAFITEADTIRAILLHSGESVTPPQRAVHIPGSPVSVSKPAALVVDPMDSGFGRRVRR